MAKTTKKQGVSGEKKTRGGAREGAGRPSLYGSETATVAAKVPVDLLARLDALAARKSWTRSQAVTEAIRRLVG